MRHHEERPAPGDDTDGAGGEGRVRNAASVSSAGVVAQAGVVHGGVHVHPVLPARGPVVPRQLPAAPGPFTGRTGQLAELDRALGGTPGSAEDAGSTPHRVPGEVVVVSAIGGAGGIGKTWLVLHWANAHLDRFPDGQLFVDLRGFSPAGEPLPPAAAVRGFLDALGTEPARIPVDLDAQAALYRSLVSDKRMLIVLDNAAGVEQVVPLLPGGDRCAVVVTSRRVLTGLITRHGARHLSLHVLADGEARALLARRLGEARVAAEPGAVAELVDWCRGFPLALGLLAGRAHAHPDLPLAELAAELRELGVEALDDEDDPTASLAAVLAGSYRALTAEQRRVFALLGIAPGPDIGLPAAASLTGLPPARTGKVLRSLDEASLCDRDATGRHRMHDLVRGYAALAADRDLAEQVREAALVRVVDFYLHTARAAAVLLNPHVETVHQDPPTPDVRAHALPDVASALGWLEAEHANLLAAQKTAATGARHEVVCQIALSLYTFHHRRGHRHDDLAVWRVAFAALGHVSDPDLHIHVHRHLGRACFRMGRHEEAVGHLHRALAMAEEHRDRLQQARAHSQLVRAWYEVGNNEVALEHAELALALVRAGDHPEREAGALNAVAWLTAQLGDHETARAHCLAALALLRDHRDPEVEAATLDSLGYVDHLTGDHRQAVEHYRRALALFRDLGDTYDAATILDHLGQSYTALGRREDARAAWGEALELYRAQARDGDAERVRRQLGSPAVRRSAGGAW
ncbi:ATP-binding protein [Saccharothrix luteola]|uniref:ATP-binding protein n=1 Tax=Saccharothrix luteola TaxID=2893018 RepID=UPI001E642EE6|nr:tetratricopeptide repeat protein [Saccharothrix luteola]MCC8246438.1 tetratricopeptide repeat protein [Saccharothrix luteola]